MLDALLPAAHRRWPDYLDPRAELIEGDVRDPDCAARAVAGVSAVSHQAAMVGLGVDFGDIADYVSHNDLGTARAAARAGGARRSRDGSCSRRAWSSTARAAIAAAEHGVVRPGPRRAGDLDAGRFEPPCPACGRALAPERVPEDAPRRPAQRLRGDQARAGAPVRRLRPRDRRRRSRRCATTTSTARGCRATPPTPASPASSARRSRPGGAARLRGRRRSGATSSTCATSPARTCSRWAPRQPGALNVASRHAADGAARWRTRSPARSPARPRPRSPASSAPATSATSSPRPSAPAAELGFTAAEDFDAGMREFATAPLR